MAGVLALGLLILSPFIVMSSPVLALLAWLFLATDKSAPLIIKPGPGIKV